MNGISQHYTNFIFMKLDIIFTTILSLFLQVFLFSQVVLTDPVFPTDDEPVTVFFDATQGNGGLAGCNCDVYLHAGLITSKSNSSSDWKYVFTDWGVANAAWKMEPVFGQPEMFSWEITPNIRQRFNVTDDQEVIQKMAFVFRNGDGSQTGRDVGGGDIFYDVHADNSLFSASFVSPSGSSVFTQDGAVISVTVAASQTATLSLFDNSNLLATTNGTTLQFDIQVSGTGTHLVEFTADNGIETITASFIYVVPISNTIAPLPGGAEPGINYISDSEITFVLVAPGKQNVFLRGDFNDWLLDTDYQLKRTPDGTMWWISVGGLTPGQTYSFQYLVDGEINIADPFSDLILDPSNDNWIDPSVFPNIHPYPTGKAFGIVSLCQPGAPEYQWQVTDFQRPEKYSLVIYEMLMRDFLTNDYNGLTAMLDYFEELGINAIELMPPNEFSGNNSWGYNPTFHFALDKAYGTPEAFKAFVDECHDRGMAVILDVVFNHTHELNPLAALYWNSQDFRPAANNPWLNEEPTHAFNVFFDFNHESFYTREYVKKVTRHWLDEYKIDGFRFDLSKGFTQNTNGPWEAGNHDVKRIETLKIYADEIWNTSTGAYVILEHFTANSEEIELSEYGMMSWSGAGVHNEYLEAAMGYNSNLSGVSYKSRGWNNPSLVAYMESHDEERMMYKNLQYGNSNGGYDVTDMSTALDRVELASTFFYTVPGPKMLWQFGELGYDFSINTCEDGVTINSDCRTSPKPVRWDYTVDQDRVDVYNVVRSLLHLRNNNEVFQTTDFDMDVDQFWKTIHLNHTTMNVAVLGNFNVINQTFNPKFQHTGTWYEYFSGDPLQVNDVNASVTFVPGEYRIYTDVQVSPPVQVTSSQEVEKEKIDWRISPNPSAGEAYLSLDLIQNQLVQVSVFDLQGKELTSLDFGELAKGVQRIELSGLPPGMYLVHLLLDEGHGVKKLVVTK